MPPVFYVISLKHDGVEGKFVRGGEECTVEEFAHDWYEDPSVVSIHHLVFLPNPRVK